MMGGPTQGALIDRKPKTDADLVLSVLLAWKGEWCPHLYRTCGVMIHSRVADLRKRGYGIECRRFAQGDYRYRLVSEPEATVPTQKEETHGEDTQTDIQ